MDLEPDCEMCHEVPFSGPEAVDSPAVLPSTKGAAPPLELRGRLADSGARVLRAWWSLWCTKGREPHLADVALEAGVSMGLAKWELAQTKGRTT